jgi:hypothetical protein
VLKAAALDEALAWGARPPSPVGRRPSPFQTADRRKQLSVLDATQIEAIISGVSFWVRSINSQRIILFQDLLQPVASSSMRLYKGPFLGRYGRS